MYATTCAISRDTSRSLLIPSLTCSRRSVTMGTHTIYQAKRTSTTVSDGGFSGTGCPPALNLAAQ